MGHIYHSLQSRFHGVLLEGEGECNRTLINRWVLNSPPGRKRVWLEGIKTFLHDRSWISPWIKSISNELNIIIHVITSQLSGYCDVINNRLWRHQQNIKRVRHGVDVWWSSFLSSFLWSICHVRNRIMDALSWGTVSALTRVSFCCLFLSLLRNSGHKHQNNPFVSAETVRHSSAPENCVNSSGLNVFCC